MISLTGVGPRNAGCAFSVLAPFDRIEPVNRPARLRLVRPRRWRARCRAIISSACGAGELRTAGRAGIDLLPHQLEPALAIVRGLGTRVLLADEVGLGKTIQAGLIVAELQARGAADRILILTPAGLREQWCSELRDRFALDFTIADMREMRRRTALLPAGLNPWITTGSAVASLDYIKRPEILPAVVACRWDVIVVDEAHGVARGSDRYDAVSSLCQRAAYVILLTATPHSGDRSQFEALCELGSLDDDRLLVFRRDRREVALGAGRRVHCLHVRASGEEQHMHDLLARFTQAVRTDRGEEDAWLALTMLHKRALSSAHSLQLSIERRLAGLASASDDSTHQLPLPLDESAGELDSSDDAPAWTAPALNDPNRERRLLGRLRDAAHAAAVAESKLNILMRLVRRLQALHEPAIVFTEYRDTLVHVRDTLRLPCAVLHGGLNRDQRRTALADFQQGRVPILLATDAGGEGLNLHHAARVVINLELPWTPTRLEQRIGRVDRIGQRRRVHGFNLIAAGTGERRIYDRLKDRIARARQDIGAADPLTASTEDEIVRLVIAGEEDAHAPSGGSAVDQRRVFVRLTEEAIRERERLVLARTVAGRHSQLTPDLDANVWIAIARRPLTRRRLAGTVLVFVRSALEDHSGRIVSSHAAALLVRPSLRIPHGASSDLVRFVRGILESLSVSTIAALCDDAIATHSESKRVHADFWQVRLLREQAIAATRTASPAMFQPGLFDGRALRHRQAIAEQKEAETLQAADFIAAAERAAPVGDQPVRPVLVLVP